MACSISGCGGEDYTTTQVDGVALKVRHPTKATVASHTGEAPGGKGVRFVHTSTDSAGAKKETVVEIADSQMTVNGKSFGPVAKGDTVVINGEAVTINGEAKSPK